MGKTYFGTIVGLLPLGLISVDSAEEPLGLGRAAAPSAPPYLGPFKLHLDSVYSPWLHILEMSTSWRLFKELQQGWLRKELNGFVRKAL